MCKEIAEDVTRGPKHDAGEETIHVEMQNLMPTRDDDVSDDGWKQATDALLAAISRDAGGVGAAELWTRPYDEGPNANMPTFVGRFDQGGVRSRAGRPAKLQRARSRLYQSKILQPNTDFAAFFEIYKISNPLHQSKPNF